MNDLANHPEHVVARQLDAYNVRDIDGFMSNWAEDAQYFEHPATLLAQGAAEIRSRHLLRFEEPDLFGRLIHRVVIGSKVIDQEKVTRNFAAGIGELDVVAIYEVLDGKICKAWFITGVVRMLTP
jgi:hypothetical protein